MPKKLSIRQERFARMVASGKSQSEAYRQAYPGSQKWLAKSVHERASALANRAKVAARVAAMNETAPTMPPSAIASPGADLPHCLAFPPAPTDPEVIR